MNESTVVKEYEFNKPDINQMDYLLDGIIKDCGNNDFNTFDYRLVYDTIFTNNSNNEEVNFTITHTSMEFKAEFHGLKKNQKCSKKWFYI